jgi:hypothetical protein
MGIRFDRRNHREATGASGSFTEWVAGGNVRLHTTVGDLTLRKPAINPNIDVVLLGRRDFFATYHVCFDERARSFFVRKHSRR